MLPCRMIYLLVPCSQTVYSAGTSYRPQPHLEGLPPDPARSEVRVRGQGCGTPHPVTLNILEGINVRGSALRNDLKLDAHLDIGSGDGLSGLSRTSSESHNYNTWGSWTKFKS